jgi:hypothetical protein
MSESLQRDGACLREGVAAGKDAGEPDHRTTRLLT